jgi:hypothetical protein
MVSLRGFCYALDIIPCQMNPQASDGGRIALHQTFDECWRDANHRDRLTPCRLGL